MSKARMAKIIAQDLRKNDEKRRKRIKNKSSKYNNQHEFLAAASRKMNKGDLHEDELLYSEDSNDEGNNNKEDDLTEQTQTSRMYTNLKKSRNFLLTMQPRMLQSDESSTDDDEQLEQDDDVKLGHLSAESMNIGLSQVAHDQELGDDLADLTVTQKIDQSIRRTKEIHQDELELQDALRPRWFIVRRSSNLRQYWDYIVMTLAIYNCIWTPLTISFDWAMEMGKTKFFGVIDNIVMGFYIGDLLVQFITSYMNVAAGDEIMKPSYIAKRYVFSGEFFIDFLATFPFRQLSLSDTNASFRLFASACQLLKALRIRKLYSVIATSNQTVETKALTKIAFYSALIFIYTHIIGCVIWYFLKEEY